MEPLLKKLNFKGNTHIVVLNAPVSLQAMVKSWEQFAPVHSSISNQPVAFALAFCRTQQQVNSAAELLSSLAEGDAILWFCYPKASSKNYSCEFNRDTGWALLGKLGWEPVRQVAIDEDWSALRFRNPAFIKTMTRSFAITQAGQQKVAKNKKNIS